MKICLVVAEGSQAGTEIPLNKFPFVIGRTPKCNLRPSSEMVSKQHCAMFLHQGRLMIRDLNSKNGTSVNGERITRSCELHHDDALKVGPLSFTVQITDAVPVNQPTPLPASLPSGDLTEDEIARLLLEMDAAEEQAAGAGGTTVILELEKADGPRDVVKAPDSKPKPTVNSSVAAQDLLKKLIRGGK